MSPSRGGGLAPSGAMPVDQYASTARNSVHPHDATSFGVGLAIENPSLKVDDLIPGCSAEKSGAVQLGDEVLAVDGTEVLHAHHAKDLILGRQGTYATITFRRIEGPNLRTFRVQLMRGSADYIFLVECLRSLEMQNAKLTEENQELRLSVPNAGGEASSMTKMLEDKVAKLYLENEQLRKRLSDEEKQTSDLRNQLSHLSSVNENALREVEGHTKKLELQGDLKGELSQMEDELQSLKRQLSVKEDENGDLRKRISFLESELDQRDNLLKKSREEASRLSAELQEVGRTEIEETQRKVVQQEPPQRAMRAAAPPPPPPPPAPEPEVQPPERSPVKQEETRAPPAPPPPRTPVADNSERTEDFEVRETESNFEETRHYIPLGPAMGQPEMLSPPMMYPPMGMPTVPFSAPYFSPGPVMAGPGYAMSPGSGIPMSESPAMGGPFRSPSTGGGSFRGRPVI